MAFVTDILLPLAQEDGFGDLWSVVALIIFVVISAIGEKIRSKLMGDEEEEPTQKKPPKPVTRQGPSSGGGEPSGRPQRPARPSGDRPATGPPSPPTARRTPPQPPRPRAPQPRPVARQAGEPPARPPQPRPTRPRPPQRAPQKPPQPQRPKPPEPPEEDARRGVLVDWSKKSEKEAPEKSIQQAEKHEREREMSRLAERIADLKKEEAKLERTKDALLVTGTSPRSFRHLNRVELRRAIVLNEILQPPIALRDPSQQAI